ETKRMCLGIPGRIVEILDADDALAVVEVGGVRRPINISFVIEPDRPAQACIGIWVLVHVGFAMSVLDEAEAARTLALLEEMQELQAELTAMELSERI